MIRMITYIKTKKITKIFKKSKKLGYYRYIHNHYRLIDRSAYTSSRMDCLTVSMSGVLGLGFCSSYCNCRANTPSRIT